MSQVMTTCAKFRALLGTFHASAAGQPPPDAELIAPSEMPDPYRGLLVHDRDMTSTLGAYHEDQILLRELERKLDGGLLARHIVLESARTRRVVENAASRIHLEVLDPEAGRKIIEGHKPLGGILNSYGVPYTSCPGGFFRVEATDFMNRLFSLNHAPWLYGRCNCLKLPTGAIIAEVVEVLPPQIDG